MTIKIDLAPEVEAELSRQAAARGRALEDHAARLLEEAAQVSGAAPRTDETGVPESLPELFAPVRGLFADGELDFSRSPSTGRPVDLA
jgi:hypothetical protein